MTIACLDLEGVLVPEIWLAFAIETGIDELRVTTREEPDYDKLMRRRIQILEREHLGLKEIQNTIAKVDILPGSKEFLDELRRRMQVIILSDTFSQFAGPLMQKLGMPTIFCNELVVDESGRITDYRMRVKESKLATVRALQSVGFETVATGDSHNDIAMLRASKKGFLFRSTPAIEAENPDLPHYTEYADLLSAFTEAAK